MAAVTPSCAPLRLVATDYRSQDWVWNTIREMCRRASSNTLQALPFEEFAFETNEMIRAFELLRRGDHVTPLRIKPSTLHVRLSNLCHAGCVNDLCSRSDVRRLEDTWPTSILPHLIGIVRALRLPSTTRGGLHHHHTLVKEHLIPAS